MRHGVRWQPPLRGTLHLARTNVFMLGGGKAMMNAYYADRPEAGRPGRATTPRSRELTMRDGDFAIGGRRAPAASAHEVARQGRRGRLRRLRGQHRLAQAVLGRRRRQLHHPRHALQPGPHAAPSCSTRRQAGRRRAASSTPWRSTRGRRSSTAASSPASTACRSASSVNQHGRALLRRGRGLLAEALRHLGRPDRAPAGPDRLLDHRRQGDRQVHAVGLPADRGELDRRAGRRQLGLDTDKLVGDRRASTTATSGPARSTRRASTTAAPRASIRQRATGPCRSTQPPFWGYPLAAGITFTYHGVDGERARAGHHARRTAGARTSSPPARSWPGNILGRGYLAGFGLTIGTVFGRIAGKGGGTAVPAR